MAGCGRLVAIVMLLAVHGRLRSVSVLLVLGVLHGACARGASVAPMVAAEASEQPRVQSNILRADYVGSDACQHCHADIYDAWKNSPMRRMTRRAGTAHVQAPFDGSIFQLGPDSVTMDTRGRRQFMRLTTGDGSDVLYRITKIIGGRTREDYVGIDVTDATDPRTDRGHGAERVMPVSFVLSTQSWRYKGYSVMIPERPGLRVGAVWGATCIGCHNTLPYLTYLYDDLYGRGAPSYQGSISDNLLPADRTWRWITRDEAGLKQTLATELSFLSGAVHDPDANSLRDLLAETISVTRRTLAGDHLVEVGIGCEACHGGSREHIEDHRVRPSFEVRSPLLAQRTPSGEPPTDAEHINRTCARCHTVLFSRYPWTWEGGRRRDRPPGGSTTNSGEARDFMLGGCASQMSCVACHDPHAEDRPQHLRDLEGAAGTALCTKCHQGLRTPEAITDHTHHDASGEGSSCLGCHMPKKTMGLGYSLTRYHRIGSPTDEARVLHDRPLECALCHEDRSVEDLVSTMERWWGKRYDRRGLRALYGSDLNAPVMHSTLERGKPHEQAVAIARYGERRTQSALPLLTPHLQHEYPLVRYYTQHAIDQITTKPTENPQP